MRYSPGLARHRPTTPDFPKSTEEKPTTIVMENAIKIQVSIQKSGEILKTLARILARVFARLLPKDPLVKNPGENLARVSPGFARVLIIWPDY